MTVVEVEDIPEEDGLDEFIKTVASGRSPNRVSVTEFTRTASHPEIDFESAEFDCEVYACKMNAAGDWLVTFKVPFAYRTTVAELSGAAGLNLHTRMEIDGFA